MADRRQLPPQIRRVELNQRAGAKPVVRYQLTVDTGTVDGKQTTAPVAIGPKRKPAKH